MSALQDYCLQVMGITQWQLKTNDNSLPKPFLLLLDETLDDQKNQLLTRLVQAMNWQGRESIESVHSDTIQDKIASAQKVVVFGEALAQKLNIKQENNLVVVPLISQMLKDLEAKKRAWGILKKLI